MDTTDDDVNDGESDKDPEANDLVLKWRVSDLQYVQIVHFIPHSSEVVKMLIGIKVTVKLFDTAKLKMPTIRAPKQRVIQFRHPLVNQVLSTYFTFVAKIVLYTYSVYAHINSGKLTWVIHMVHRLGAIT